MCVGVCAYKARRGCLSLGVGITANCELQTWVLETKLESSLRELYKRAVHVPNCLAISPALVFSQK